MKRAYLVHGWEGSPEGNFLPWLKRQLEAQGYEVVVPAMPDTAKPVIGAWVSHLQSLVQAPDEETVFVGHSMGAPAILHYLETLPEGTKVGKVVFVAPVVHAITGLGPEEELIAKPWFETPINAEKVKRSTSSEIIAFFSDNDPWIPLESERLLRERYGARTIIEPGMGHYNADAHVTEVPSVLREILA